MSRYCPHCNKMAVYKNKPLYNGIVVFKSVHSECPHCKEKIVCGFKGPHGKPINDDDFIVITEEYYKELTSDVKKKQT